MTFYGQALASAAAVTDALPAQIHVEHATVTLTPPCWVRGVARLEGTWSRGRKHGHVILEVESVATFASEMRLSLSDGMPRRTRRALASAVLWEIRRLASRPQGTRVVRIDEPEQVFATTSL